MRARTRPEQPKRTGWNVEIARGVHRDAVVELWLDLIEHHRRADPELVVPLGLRARLRSEVGRALRSSRCRVLIARGEAGILGFALAEVEAIRSPETNRAGTGWIHELYVAPAYRRLGIGRALAAGAEAFFQEAGAGRPTVRVEASNRTALRFWRRMGFSARARILEKRS